MCVCMHVCVRVHLCMSVCVHTSRAVDSDSGLGLGPDSVLFAGLVLGAEADRVPESGHTHNYAFLPF